MKKFSLLFAAVLTLCCGVCLAACNFKTPTLNFDEDVVMLSVGEEINLDDMLTAKDVDKADVEYKFSSTSFFEREGNVLRSTTFGQTMVYATYDGNSLDSFLLVVKKPFEQVANIQMDDFGLVTWNQVVDKFDDSEDFVTASTYVLDVHFVDEDESFEEDYSFSTADNFYQLEENGKYTLTIYAEEEDKFERSAASTKTVYFGYMPELVYDDFKFDTESETMTWNEVSGATYSVTFNGEVVVAESDESDDNFVNLSSYLSSLTAGNYSFEVRVHDKEKVKISKASEEISVVKLESPVLENAFDEENGGRMAVTLAENSLKAVAYVDERSFEFEDDALTTFDGISAGEHLVSIQSLAVESKRDGVFYANSERIDGARIYKLDALQVAGSGENEENSDTFNITLTSSAAVTPTMIKTILVKGDETTESLISDGFEIDDTTIQSEVALDGAGEYALTALNYAKSATLSTDGELYIINSNASNSLSFTKLTATTSITHSYGESGSILEFAQVENAEIYLLKVLNGGAFEDVDADLYEMTGNTITFTDNIENLFDASYFTDDMVTFKLVASREDETTSISSSATKTLTRLDAPTSESGNDENVEYSWNEVVGAGEYIVKYSYIDKSVFDAGLDEISVSEFDTEETVSENVITLTSGNYYYIEIVATPSDENENLNSSAFKNIFYITKQLSTPVVHFGLDSELVSGDFVSASGYFVNVENVENMAGLSVTLDDSAVEYDFAGENSTYFLFTDDFTTTSPRTIQVVATAEDSRLYPNSTPYVLTIKRLDASYSSISSYLSIDEFSSTLTLRSGMEGVTSMRIDENETNYATGSNERDAVLNISKISNSTITINLVGSAFSEETHTYQATNTDTTNTVYLESVGKVYRIQRLNAPTNFDYYNGNFTFTDVVSIGSYYVLDMRMKDANNRDVLMKIDLRGASTPLRLAIYDASTMSVLMNKTSFEGGESILTETSGTKSINYQALLDLLMTNATFSSYYSQATEITFSLYNYLNYFLNDTFTISSLNASCSDGETSLVVKKMQVPEVTYDKETGMLVWTLNQENYGHLSDTKFDIYTYNDENEDTLLTTISTMQYDVQATSFEYSKDYMYHVVAKNPYYLESSSSRVVTLHVISPVEKVQLSDNSLIFTPNSSDLTYITGVNYRLNDEVNVVADMVGNSYILSNFSEGSYQFNYVGTTEFESEGRYYLDSSVTSYTLSALSSLAPDVTQVTYEVNIVSFGALKNNLQTLKYRIVFKDAQENTAVIESSVNSCEVSPEGDPFRELSAGEITISVYAVLSSYSVSAGGTIYFNSTLTTIGEEEFYNAYSYPQPTSILKLPTPTVSDVVFVGDNAEALRPSMEIHITGDYGNNDTFVVYVNDNTENIGEFSASEVQGDGEYILTIDYDKYISYFNNGLNDVKVAVTSSENIPSSMNSVKVYFANSLATISQVEAENTLSKEIEITFSSEEDVSYANGGVMLEITYTPYGAEEQKEYILIDSTNFTGTTLRYDLTDFILNNMQNGGSLSYRAFVNSYSDGESYILASDSIMSANYEVVATPIYTEEDDDANTIELTNEGVLIGVQPGSEDANFLITYSDGTNMQSVVIGEEENYFFEYPDSWISNETYTLSIMAFAEGKISSSVIRVSVLLNRLARVENVTLVRDADDLSLVSLKWDAVENADYYIVRAYILNGGEKTYVGEVAERAETEVLMSAIFGNNYENLSSFVSVGIDFYIEIISSSFAGYHNSQVRLVNANLIGTMTNDLDSSDMDITDNGELYFSATAGKSYLYSIVSVDGLTTYLPWTMVTAESDNVMIDISKVELITSDINFRVRVMLAGDATTDGVVYNDDVILLHFDSQYIQGGKVFMQSHAAEEVQVNTVDNSKLSIVVQNEVVKVFASLSDEFKLDDAVFIEGIYDTFLADAGRYIYNLNMSLLFEKFALTSDTTIYFYVVEESIENEIYYVVSKATAYNFKHLSQDSVVDVRKVTEGETKDFVRTYIVFNERTDVTLTGFNIIIDYTNPNNTSETLRFNVMLQIDGTTIVDGVELANTYATLVDGEILIDVYGILSELDTVFEYEDSTQIISPNLSGEGEYMFHISEVGALGEEIYYSDYITTFEDEDLLFTKLPEALSVNIESGNVVWEINETYLGLIEKFYIYLYDYNAPENFNRYETADNTIRTFNGDEFMCAANEYNISLSCVSSNPFVIASNESYVLDTSNNVAIIVKNQFNSKLSLSGGTLSINWNSGMTWTDAIESQHDIYELLSGIRAGGDVTQSLIADLLDTTFYYPFTFTINDLVNGNVRIRFRFTSYVDAEKTTIGFRRVADVDARYILSGNLLGTSDIDELSALQEEFENNSRSASERTIITNFFNILKYSVGGIGNYVNIFDFAFEAIQEGKYEIEYCLLGNSSTLTSEWQILTTGDNQDYYVNPTVHVEAGVDEISGDIVSAYYIKIYRSQIYMQNGTKEDATHYFMQIYNQNQAMSEKYGVEISTGNNGESWNAKLAGVDGASFSVSSVDEDDDGEYDYLKLYLNLSVDESGTKGYDAILSQYLDTFAKGSYYFEVFAQGNNYSISSKSTIFSMTLYSACQNFQITNGEFSWTAFQNLPTQIIYKSVSSREPATTSVDPQEQSLAHFSLNDLPAGEYEYIKFATLGSVSNNHISIDSEVYVVENVYKLSDPTVTTELNAFALQDNNRSVYGSIYSDDRSVKYEVNNNYNTQNTSFIFTSQSYDSTATKSIYEAGTTNYQTSTDDSDYVYKLTELSADKFSFTTLGSTASYSAERDIEESNVYNLVINNQGTSYNSVAVKSNAVQISGKMLPSVPTASVHDGIVSWSPISLQGTGLGSGNTTIVYEVGVQFYELTNTAQSVTMSNIGTEIVSYTTETSFDLAKIEDSFPATVGGRVEYVRVTLQAMALSVSNTAPTGSYITLDDGRYAYGDMIAYTSSAPTEEAMPYILRSNGYSIEGLTMAPSVTNLGVTDGRLTWQYTTNEDVTFVVTDGNGNIIEGEYVTADNINYTFVENSGEILAGANTVNVYVVSTVGNTLKSRKTSIDVYKLAALTESTDENGDYTIENISINVGDDVVYGEVIDFANYFDKNDLAYSVSLKIGDFELTKDDSRILILSSQDDYDAINDLLPSVFDGYANVIVVTDGWNVVVSATNLNAEQENVLTSDEYNLILNRPAADYTIVWNTETQTFTWSSETQTEDENTIFLVDVIYSYSSGGRQIEESRRYEIRYENGGIVKEFTPTIVGNVNFSLTVKYGSQGLQSQRKEYGSNVYFGLFSSGAGTTESPYVITSNEQFMNMAHRMTKLSYLNTYLLNGESTTDESDNYTFRIDADILDLNFNDILFPGEFSGDIIGGGHTISYTANAVSSNNISSQTVSVGQITGLNTGDSGIAFTRGLSLFEKISGNITNLKISAIFNASAVINANTLFAGLAIENMSSAIIQDVEIESITSTAAVQNNARQTVAVYAGIVAFNNGRVRNSKVSGSIEVSDANAMGVQNIFVGGISYTSLGTIENCSLEGSVILNLTNTGGGKHQVAGITVTSTGTLQNNTISTGSVVRATGVSGNSHIVYIGGIAVYAATGTVSGNTSFENCTEAVDIYSAIRSDNICNTGI